MARTPIQPIPLSAQLQPQAQPIDTYVKPPARNQLHDLADALGSVDQSLQNFLSIRDEKQQQDDYLRGQAAYYTDHEGEFAKAVTDGKIPAQYSPFYVNGFKNAQGQAMGDKLSQGWQQAWDTWDGKNTEDPQAFDTFFQGYLKQNLGTNDPQVLKGVLPQVRALHDKAYEQYTQYRHQATVEGNLTAHTAVIANTVQDGVDQGLASGDPKKGTDYTGIFGRVNDTIAKTLATGDPNGKAVDTFIDAMAAKIVATRDPKLLDWFQTKVPGKDYTFGSTPHGLEVVNQTVKHLETEARQAAAGMSAAERQAMEKAKDEAQSGIIKGLIDNPNKAIDEKLLQQAEKNGDPLIRVHSVEWAKTLQQGYSDPKKVASFYDDVISGRTSPQQALREALSHGVFGSAEDMRAAASFVQNYRTYEDTIEKALGGRMATLVTNTIKERTQGKDTDPMNPITGLTNQGLAATSDFRQLLARWIMANPNASQAEIEDQTNKFGKMILGNLTAEDAFSQAGYNRNPDLPFGNPYAPDQQGNDPNAPPPYNGNGVQGEGAQQPAQEGQGKPPTTEAQPQDQQMERSKDPTVRKWEEDNSLRPDQKTLIEKQAQQFGMTYDQFIHERALRDTAPATPPAKQADPNAPTQTDPNAGLLHKTAYNPNSKDLGEGDQSGSGMTPETAGQMLDQAFSPAVDITGQSNVGSLKALIRQHESSGDYNAVFGSINDPNRDLSQYTVDEILGQQQYARMHGAKSTATGAYQIIYKTLKGLKAQMGLDGSEKFTPELQDKMADVLLNNRGLKDFQNGRMSKKAFALSLSQEWASLPDPRTGRSFYAGDGLNAALTSTSKVYEALGFTGTPQVQNAAYTPSAGSTGWAPPNPNAYANIPEADSKGQGGQRSKFLEWNSDPVANNERNLSEIQPQLADVVRKAQTLLPFKIVIGSGKRTAEQQQKAVDWGWSKTLDSDHLDGHAADIWVIDQNGAVVFDKKQQLEVAKAMKQAAGELGVGLDVGADWKRFKDLPHFALKRKGTTA